MLLIYAPVAIPSEPPAGVAFLAGALQAAGQPCTAVDLNIEGLLYLLHRQPAADDTFTRRAEKNLHLNLQRLRSPQLYQNFARYQKTVMELNRIVETHGVASTGLNLTNYQDDRLSPLKSDDLLQMAERPKHSIFYDFFRQRLAGLLDRCSSSSIGISINYMSQALSSFALIGCIKELAPEKKIIAGGGLITSWLRSPLWSNPFAGLIDECVDGCGLESLLRSCQRPHPPAFLPAYGYFPIKEYLSPGVILPYNCSTGCYWNKCSFCPEKAEGNSFSMKSPKQVVADLVTLSNANDSVLLHLLDNAIPTATLKCLAQSTTLRPWYGFVRISRLLLDLDFCHQLRKAGCVMLKLGVESGDQQVLDRLHKGVEVSDVAQVLKNLATADISSYVYLLFGTPAETYESARKTLSFIQQYHQYITFINLAIFNMPINSDDWQALEKDPFSAADLSLYSDFIHPSGWDRRSVRSFLEREFKRPKEIRDILRRDPPYFSSNHAALFNPTFPWPRL